MDDDRLHQPARKSSKQAAHVPLLPLAPSFSSPQRPTTCRPSVPLPPIAPFAHRQPSILNHPDDSHAQFVDACTNWILQRVDELVALDQGPPLVVPLTVTFSPGSIRPDQVLCEYERFYARLCRLLMSNPDRPSKRHLLPFSIAFRDDVRQPQPARRRAVRARDPRADDCRPRRQQVAGPRLDPPRGRLLRQAGTPAAPRRRQ
jgi:hypothetical protein